MDFDMIPGSVRETTLPGVGKKYVLTLGDGGNLVVIVKPDGERQLYHFLAAEDRPRDVVTLTKAEAQQIANLLGPPLVSAPDLKQLELALGALELEWVELSETSDLTGKTLDDVQLRTRTGASVVAIMRGTRAIPNPAPDIRFAAGDTVVLIGTHEQCVAARNLILGS